MNYILVGCPCLQNSIKHSGSERVFKGNCKIYICHYFCFCHYFLLLMVIKNRKNWHCIYNEWPQRNDLLKKSRHEDKQCTVSSGIRDLRLLQTPSLLTNRLFMFQSYSTQNVILYFDEQWPGVYPQPGMVRHKMLLFQLISFSVIVVAVVLLFLSSSVTTLQGSPLTICCAYTSVVTSIYLAFEDRNFSGGVFSFELFIRTPELKQFLWVSLNIN